MAALFAIAIYTILINKGTDTGPTTYITVTD
jgi:hypothetical protein